MAKSLKKYKKPPRSAREPVEEPVTPPKQRKAMKALGIQLKAAPVKKTKAEKYAAEAEKKAAVAAQKVDSSEAESEKRVDSGNEVEQYRVRRYVEPPLSVSDVPRQSCHKIHVTDLISQSAALLPAKEPSARRYVEPPLSVSDTFPRRYHEVQTTDDSSQSAALLPAKDTSKKPEESLPPTTVEPAIEDEGPVSPNFPFFSPILTNTHPSQTLTPATLAFIAKWLPKWHAYCQAFPALSDFSAVAPYCNTGMDLVLAFTHDVTAQHISKKGLPFDKSPSNALPHEVEFNNVFYPADKVRNFIDINIRRFELFKEGEEMEGRMWVDMDARYKRNVDLLLEKVARFRSIGAWEKESRRVNEMIKYGVFGRVEKDGEEADDEGSEDS
jgi:hypothetical protein